MILDDVRFIPSRRGLTRSARLLRARRERPRGGSAADERDELAPLHVSRATVWRSLSGWLAAHSGYHGGTGQVLGANLNCSESRRWPAPQTRIAHGERLDGHVEEALLDFTCSCQASAEHFQQCAEFLPLRNRGLGPLAVTILPIALAPGGPPASNGTRAARRSGMLRR
jgi:hypothetical protein